ncbi:hypothetical protein [Flavobacterium reichenbachii]|uniref:hypothetical protein n=1 Tax=Flavobacterium reichenbachii TaxID=362418 RepID=UPI000B5B6611|nr:hypothetical protein [Flavobacterium reichenbachii]OXB15792.1 hypothetical protein B0A68_09000 [Flavobacterium reichenbachii]
MKINFTIFFFINSLFAFSQNNETPLLPQIISASPEASSLGQYGSVPVNLSAGQINYTIPIYTIKSGDFEYPLTLSYSYNGFKPENDPTMVGMGWVANFGGAVIRQLQGAADEDMAIGYLKTGKTYENLASLSISDKVYALKNAVDHGFDTQPDNFIINTSTINGNFRFNTDKIPIFSEHRNYKVNLANDSFKITDDKGVQYNFNDTEYTETQVWLNGGSETSYLSSFMLSNILLPSNSSLNFEYDYYSTSHIYNTVSKEVKTFRRFYNGPGSGAGTGGEDQGVFYSHITDDKTLSKIIKKITFPNGYILFEQKKEVFSGNTVGININFGATDRIKLQSVSVYNLDDKLVEKFIFNYYDCGYYYFLKSIKKVTNNGDQIDYYTFEYSNLSDIPYNRISSNQIDLWGFYNGIILNEANPQSSLDPIFDKGKIGALTKITYPTKGTTEIQYENNEINRTNYYNPSNQIYNVSESLKFSAEETIHECDSREKLITIPFDQIVRVTLEVNVTAEKSWARSTFFSTTNQELASISRSEETLRLYGGSTYVTQEFSLDLKAGTYKLFADLCEDRTRNRNTLCKNNYRL